MDIDSLAPGVDFADAIESHIGSCDILLAVIGRNWLSAKDEEGRARLENPDDFVRLEIGAALKRGVRVIPILVGGARMPRSQELPPELAGLARRQAFTVYDDDFRGRIDLLIKDIEGTPGPVTGPEPNQPEPTATAPEADRTREPLEQPQVHTTEVAERQLREQQLAIDSDRERPAGIIQKIGAGRFVLAVAAILLISAILAIAFHRPNPQPPMIEPTPVVSPSQGAGAQKHYWVLIIGKDDKDLDRARVFLQDWGFARRLHQPRAAQLEVGPLTQAEAIVLADRLGKSGYRNTQVRG